MLQYKKNTGNGYSQCMICSARGKWNVQWHDSTVSLVGYNTTYCFHPICFDCLKKIAAAFDEELEEVK